MTPSDMSSKVAVWNSVVSPSSSAIFYARRFEETHVAAAAVTLHAFWPAARRVGKLKHRRRHHGARDLKQGSLGDVSHTSPLPFGDIHPTVPDIAGGRVVQIDDWCVGIAFHCQERRLGRFVRQLGNPAAERMGEFALRLASVDGDGPIPRIPRLAPQMTDLDARAVEVCVRL